MRPRRWVYLLPMVFLAAAAIPSALWLVEGIEGIRAPLKRMVAPGTDEIDLDRTGEWTVFHEHRGSVDGRAIQSSPEAPVLEITITSAQGQELSVDGSSGSMTYNTTSAAGSSIASVAVPEAGVYTVTVEDRSAVPQGETIVAFGHEKGRAVGRTIIGAVLLGTALLVAAIAAGIIFFLRVRSKHRREAALTSYGMPPPPPGV